MPPGLGIVQSGSPMHWFYQRIEQRIEQRIVQKIESNKTGSCKRFPAFFVVPLRKTHKNHPKRIGAALAKTRRE